MTASSSHAVPDELAEENTTIITLEDELKNFKLQSFNVESIPSFITDLTQALNPLERCFSYSLDAAVELERLNKHEQVKSLQDKIPNVIELEHQLKTQKKILEDIQNRIRREPMNDIVEAYKREWTRENAKRQLLSDKKKYKKHSYYTGFKHEVWQVNHEENEPMPESDDDDDDDDDDVVVGHVTLSTTCPITQSFLENPVTSQTCKHTYSKYAIMELIRKSRGRVQCPNSGCSQLVTANVLVEDGLAERRVARMRASEASQRRT
ncbi:zinc-finger of the MIZ type in Nse subunit-domain-containing protein, partial [Circinella umbellata]